MSVLTDAELLLGLSRHLSAFASGPDRAALSELEFLGHVYDLAFRLRGSTTNTAERVYALAVDIGCGRREVKELIAMLESLGWLTVERDSQNIPQSVSEALPPAENLIAAAPRLLEVAQVSSVELASLAILRATTLQPLMQADALETGSQAASGETEPAEDAVRHLTAIQLIRSSSTDSERDVLYNPNIWTQSDQIANAALRAADAHGTKEIQALLEEVSETPGLPESRVTSTEVKWIKFAITQGLLQRSVIQTTDGTEQGFLFTPHLARDPFGGSAGDASGHVRQLVGSMVYAATFAEYRLYAPDKFLSALIRNGVAGDTHSIGTDYPMLEKAGIVRVVPGTGSKSRMELLQADVAEDALKLLSESAGQSDSTNDVAALQGQKTYLSIERNRAKLALEPESDIAEEERLIASLRDVTRNQVFGRSAW